MDQSKADLNLAVGWRLSEVDSDGVLLCEGDLRQMYDLSWASATPPKDEIKNSPYGPSQHQVTLYYDTLKEAHS